MAAETFDDDFQSSEAFFATNSGEDATPSQSGLAWHVRAKTLQPTLQVLSTALDFEDLRAIQFEHLFNLKQIWSELGQVPNLKPYPSLENSTQSLRDAKGFKFGIA